MRINDRLWVRSKIFLQLDEVEETNRNHMTYYKYDCGLCTPSQRRCYFIIYRKVEISSELEIWNEAMLEEINSLQKNDS